SLSLKYQSLSIFCRYGMLCTIYSSHNLSLPMRHPMFHFPNFLSNQILKHFVTRHFCQRKTKNTFLTLKTRALKEDRLLLAPIHIALSRIMDVH
ncbi:hypothetical protein L9F63_004005, partial [Diploptera punctata]